MPSSEPGLDAGTRDPGWILHDHCGQHKKLLENRLNLRVTAYSTGYDDLVEDSVDSCVSGLAPAETLIHAAALDLRSRSNGTERSVGRMIALARTVAPATVKGAK
jgi:hypothetical protein